MADPRSRTPSRPRFLAASPLLAACLAAVACDGLGSGPMADAGGEPPGSCGGLDRLCCPGDIPCVGNLICAGSAGEDPSCRAGCLPAQCATSEAVPRTGVCQDVFGGEGLGVCIDDVVPSPCDPSSLAPCTTAYGVRGLCVSDGIDTYCFEECTPSATGCSDAHLCVPLAEAAPGGIEGVCVPEA